ncbi:hypothetical protein BHE74_00055958 [Ensete ventricosum]|nr:hypothetical protein BHE74_00055958 [Ensete ventricosum]
MPHYVAATTTSLLVATSITHTASGDCNNVTNFTAAMIVIACNGCSSTTIVYNYCDNCSNVVLATSAGRG